MELKKHGVDYFKKYGFDLTTIGSAEKFQEILEHHGLTEYKRVERDSGHYSYIWYNPRKNLFLKTANNPITGKYSDPDKREDEKGYASYMAFVGKNKKALKALIWDIGNKADHVKDAGHGFAGIMEDTLRGVTDE